MFPSLLDFLRHILHECNYIIKVTQGKTHDQLFDDETLSKAIVRSLEIIGEATKKLPEDFRASNPQISWDEMSGMRNVLIHHYFGIENDVVWSTIKNDIPQLRDELQRIIDVNS